jgi:hypothetical protein
LRQPDRHVGGCANADADQPASGRWRGWWARGHQHTDADGDAHADDHTHAGATHADGHTDASDDRHTYPFTDTYSDSTATAATGGPEPGASGGGRRGD